MHADIRVPEDRVGALIGNRRRELLKIERATRTKIKVVENSVTIEGESLNVWKAREVVRAVGRGFSPARAMKLLEDAVLDVMDLSGLSDSRQRAVRSRIIGAKGRTRELIEELTGTRVSVYGKTVSIIGGPNGVSAARTALEMIVTGVRHAKVYDYLETWRKAQDMV